jgi:spore germination protein (amino acid permease)
MDKIKITNHQLFSLTACNSTGAGVIITSALIAGIAKQDAWLAALFTPVMGVVVIWIMSYLSGKFPDMTFIGVIKSICGKWIGTVVALSFVILCLTIAYHMPWYISNFMNTHVMPETPAYVINFLFVAAAVIAILYGIETIARASEVFITLASILFLIAMILVSPNIKPQNIQPVLEKGIIPVLKGGVVLSCYTTLHTIILMMVYPVNIVNIKEGRKSILKGYLWASSIIFVTILMSVLVLGSVVTAKSQYPTYILAKEINLAIVFSRFEFIIAALWIVTEYIICILFFYAGITGLSEIIGLKDYRKIVIPMGLIVLVMSDVVFPNNVYQVNWVNTTWTPYIITHGFILPALLLIIYFIKK